MSHNPNNEELIKNALRQGDGIVENVFNSIKSQHELNTCNDGKRSSDVLLSTIEELERTKKQLDKAKKSIQSALQYLACMDRISEEKCNEQLAFDELRKTLEELNK